MNLRLAQKALSASLAAILLLLVVGAAFHDGDHELHAADQWAAEPATVEDVLEAQRWARRHARHIMEHTLEYTVDHTAREVTAQR